MTTPGLPIAAVERETGIARQLLRMWERRYGYPQPLRDANGNRVYPSEQVAQLARIRRLMDMGLRPGRLMHLSAAELDTLAAQHRPPVTPSAHCTDLLSQLVSGDAPALTRSLAERLQTMGLGAFVSTFLPAANLLVGDAWSRGEIRIYHEHLYTESVIRLLREALRTPGPAAAPPRVMLTTTPGEAHTLGLLMAEALLREAGCDCLGFGPGLPFAEMAQAMHQHRVDVLALSFSLAYGGPLQKEVAALLALLPPGTQLWIGGAGCRQLKLRDPRLWVAPSLAALGSQVEYWRTQHARAGG